MDEDLKDFFLCWCEHLVERVVRLRQYLAERWASVPSGSHYPPDFVADLLDRNDILALKLKALNDQLVESSPSTIYQKRDTYYTELRAKHITNFRNIHKFLSNLPAPWPQPELSLFVREVLSVSGYSAGRFETTKFPWTILLAGEYNFSDIMVFDVSRSDRHMIGKEKEDSIKESDSPLLDVLTIPAAEKDNPLAWFNLIHELGHSIGQRHGIIKQASELKRVQKLTPEIRGVLIQHWIPEIVSDLIATDLSGIGYYASLSTFAAYWTEKSVLKPSITHPPINTRREYIYERLKSLGKLDEKTKSDLDGQYDLRHILDNEDIIVRSDMFDTVQARSSDFYGYDYSKDVKELAEDIWSLDEYKSLIKYPGGSEDIDNLRMLSACLLEGHLAVSHNKNKNVKKWIVSEVMSDLASAKKALIQTNNDIREIMTAACVAKLLLKEERPHELLSLVFNDREPNIRRSLIDAWSYVHKSDITITKSIEASQIMKFYQSAPKLHER